MRSNIPTLERSRLFLTVIIWRSKILGSGSSHRIFHVFFEKGFTGYNGRQDQRASGLGLYLSQKSCAQIRV